MSTTEEEVPTEDQQNQDQAPSPSQTDGDQSSATPTPQSDPATGGQTAFTHARLVGKSVTDAEAYVDLLERTVQSQSAKLSDAASAPAPAPAAPAAEGDFYQDPIGVLRQELRAAVEPINQEIANIKAQAEVNTAWSEVAQRFADFNEYKPYVETLVRNSGVTPDKIDANVLESYYYAAVGYVAKQREKSGVPATPPQAPAPQEPQPRAPQMNIPQHSPSSAPLPQSAPQSQARQLTEEEARLAREWGMSKEEYLALQGMDEVDVVTYDKEAIKEGRVVING